MERLQKVIAGSGYTSRRNAEKLIQEGHVYVNDELVTELGTKVNGNDIISIDGNVINRCDDKVYYLLNKPREIISSVSDEAGRKTVIDLIETDKRIYPVGRLDYDTTGLIILTNDGELTNFLISAKNNIPKTYLAKINGILNGNDFLKIKNGIYIDNRKVIIDNLKVKKIDKIKNTSLIEITIHEGRNHIIRRFFEALHYDVKKLHRSKYGNLTDKDLKSGEYRELSKKEIKILYSLK